MSGQGYEYIYDAVGNKIRYNTPGGGKIDYVGNLVFDNSSDPDILTSEGRITGYGGNYSYEYYLTDHLGNTRGVINQASEILQVSNYYPFGMRHEPITQEDATQKYLYQGKERKPELDLYDFGARHYDDGLGRWLATDPMASSFASESPYSGMGNNPVRMIDPDGRCYGAMNPNSHLGYPYSPLRDRSSVPCGTMRYDRMIGRNTNMSDYDEGPYKTADYLSTDISNELWMALTNPSGYGMENYTASLTPGKVAQLSEGDKRALSNAGYLKVTGYEPWGYYVYDQVNDEIVKNVVRGYNPVYELASSGGNGLPIIDGVTGPWSHDAMQEAGFGEHLIGPTMIALGANILPTRGKFKGATKGTSIASKYLSKKLPQKLSFRFMGTNVLGRMIGRLVPYAGWALTINDVNNVLQESFPSYEEFWDVQHRLNEKYGGGPVYIDSHGMYVCFVEGTKVYAKNGLTDIEELQKGNLVYSYNLESRKVELKPITQCYVREVQEVYSIIIEEEEIKVTSEHPFFIDGKGWIKVKDLQKNDLLMDSNGSMKEILEITKTSQTITVYNINVADNHNYFVGLSKVLVHNK